MSETDDTTQKMRLLEAMLFASTEPLSVAALQQKMGEGISTEELLARLQEEYAERGVHLVETDGVWSFRTAPDLAGFLQITTQPRRKLPRATAETLAIIAYHQPVTRAEIESIRGVATSTGTLDMLMEIGWVRPGKRRETPGRPVTWVTTPDFLSHFNLGALSELPGMEELKASGLLDARPVLATMTVDENDTTLDADRDNGDEGHWIAEDDPQPEAREA